MMRLGHIGRLVAVMVVAGALFAGGLVATAGVAGAGGTTYSDEDCEVLNNIEVESAENGYYGRTAANASRAFADAADDIEDEDLADAMTTLSSVWKKASKGNAIAAARAIGRAGRKYSNALEVYTKALITCSTQSLDFAEDEDSEDDDSTTTTTRR
jgi:hypothetical protein